MRVAASRRKVSMKALLTTVVTAALEPPDAPTLKPTPPILTDKEPARDEGNLLGNPLAREQQLRNNERLEQMSAGFRSEANPAAMLPALIISGQSAIDVLAEIFAVALPRLVPADDAKETPEAAIVPSPPTLTREQQAEEAAAIRAELDRARESSPRDDARVAELLAKIESLEARARSGGKAMREPKKKRAG